MAENARKALLRGDEKEVNIFSHCVQVEVEVPLTLLTVLG
jgi:hypothetical protein